MKLITAIIRPEKLEDVKAALFAAEVKGSPSCRCRATAARRPSWRATAAPDPLRVPREGAARHRRLRTFVDITIQAILGAARTGEVGDGKIFVQPLDRVIRIRTGRTRPEALTPEPLRHH